MKINDLAEQILNAANRTANAKLGAKTNGEPSFAELLNESDAKIARQKTALVLSRDEKQSEAEARVERKKARAKLLKKQEIAELYDERVQNPAIEDLQTQIRRNERAAAQNGEQSAIATSKPPIVTHSLAAFILADLVGG